MPPTGRQHSGDWPVLDGSEEDPYAVRANAPISVVKAAKASLREPSRPMTPADMGVRQLFTRDSEFAQQRPSSAYGVPGSKLFFQDNPKLNIAKLDPHARPAEAGALSTRRSILEGGPSAQRSGSSQAERTSWSHSLESRSSYHDESGGDVLLQHQVSGGRPTAAETVQALKASMAAVELGFKPASELCDIGGPDRPSTALGRPDTAYAHAQSSAQVLDLSQMQQYSDSDDSDGDLYDSALQQPAAEQAPGAAQQPALLVLDSSDAFVAWRSRMDEVLQQLAAATAALAAATAGVSSTATGRPQTASQRSSHTGNPETGSVANRKAALAQVMEACAKLLAAVIHARTQPTASQWLNSSSAVYRDSQGKALSLREAITEHVFRLMDSNAVELLLKASSVVLRVVRSRAPLQHAGKLLYKLSKDSTNDPLFRREALLEPMTRTIHIMIASNDKEHSTSGSTDTSSTQQKQRPQHSLYEPLTFYCGALKNISNDGQNQRVLVKAHAVHILCQALAAMISQTQSTTITDTASSTGPSQVAVQITGVLRNLAVPPAHVPIFLAAGALPVLRKALACLGHHSELALNIGRVLSKLSLHEDAQAAIEADPQYAQLLVTTLQHYAYSPPMLVRVAFVLGNLTTTSDAYRMQVVSVPGAVDMLEATLQAYASGNLPAAPHSHQPHTPSKIQRPQQAASHNDCIVKLLRLIANLAIHTKVGPGLASRPALAGCLLQLLESHPYEGDSEELALNAVCAVTNLSFYNTQDNKVMSLDPVRLLRCITPLLLSSSCCSTAASSSSSIEEDASQQQRPRNQVGSDTGSGNEEAVIEAARAFGNLSRAAAARQALVSGRVLDALVLLLDHSSWEVLYSVCGTLINFSADAGPQGMGALLQLHAPSRLLDVLMRCASTQPACDMQVACLCVVCKALFNLLSGDTAAQQHHQQQPASQSDGLVVADLQLDSVRKAVANIQSNAGLMAKPEVPQVTHRLLSACSRHDAKQQPAASR